MRTAATQTHFGNPGNHFWPALHRAGILAETVDSLAAAYAGPARAAGLLR